jgi:hypothetical protein
VELRPMEVERRKELLEMSASCDRIQTRSGQAGRRLPPTEMNVSEKFTPSFDDAGLGFVKERMLRHWHRQTIRQRTWVRLLSDTSVV